jgi:prepilin-type N-terminal cleavage/methylation domain-containing protein
MSEFRFHPQPALPLGFTLIELAIVLVIVGLVLGGLIVPLASQVQSRKVGETESAMRNNNEALLGFAIANGRLPCPATIATNGLENRRNDNAAAGAIDASTDGCRGGNYVGFLPWATLGVAESDVWGNRYLYRVTNEFTRAKDDATALSCASPPPVVPGTEPNTCTLDLTDSGDLAVESRDLSTKAKRNLSVQVPAIIISFGPNGHGATSSQNIAQPVPAVVNVDENQNLNAASLVFLSRSATAIQVACSDTAAGQPFCEFDDIVSWIPSSILFSRILAAGRLP